MADTGGTKLRNLLLILKTIDGAGEATAAMLTEQTGLSVATISRGLSILKAKRLVVQRRKDATEVGRRPEVFSIDPSYGYYLYFWLESGQLRGYLLDLSGRTTARAMVPAGPETTVERLLDLLQQLRDQLLTTKKRAVDKLLAVNLAIPGLADVSSGVISRIPNYPCFENVDLAGQVRQTLGLPCFVHNSARLTAVGEYLLSGGELENLVYVDITGDGIGAGIILGGVLYEDRNCLAGEIGDMIIDVEKGGWQEPKTQGALERQAGLGTVYRELRRLLAEGHAKELRLLMEQKKTRELSVPLLEKAVANLDLDVYEILNQATKAWAAAIVNIAALLSPDVVVLGGAVNDTDHLIEKMVRHHLGRMYYRPIHLRLAKKDADTHVLGAAHLSRKYLFNVVLNEFLDELGT